MKRLVIAALLVAGCATAPPDPPPPERSVVVCQVDDAMTLQESPPDIPRGDYSQRDVASFVVALEAWGQAAWTRIRRIQERSDECVRRARLRAGGQEQSEGN